MSEWQQELHRRLTDIRTRKENRNMSDEKNEVTEVIETPLPDDDTPGETKVEVVSLGWGILVNGALVSAPNEKLSKTDARKQAVAIAREQKPAVVTVRSAAGEKQRREWF